VTEKPVPERSLVDVVYVTVSDTAKSAVANIEPMDALKLKCPPLDCDFPSSVTTSTDVDTVLYSPD